MTAAGRTRPRFSIVIPTRDRPALLARALRTACAQTVGRDESRATIEIVVSDNAPNGTGADVVARCHDPRVRYVRTPRALLMHDSWAFAMRQARGEFVCVLCDDDAYHPRLLAIVDRVIDATGADVIFWGRCGYRCRDTDRALSRDRVEFRTVYTDRVLSINADHLVDAAYEMGITNNDYVPRMLNTCVARAVVERAESRGTPFFRPICPDYSSMLAMSLHGRRMVMIDAPLSVTGVTPESTGWLVEQATHVGADAGESTVPRFVREIMAETPGMLTLPFMGTINSVIGQTYAQCAHDDPQLAGRRIDPVKLWGVIGVELARAEERYGVRRFVREAFDRVVETLPPAEAGAVRAFVEARRAIETDAFVGAPIDGVMGIGAGAFVTRGVEEVDVAGIDRFAASLDSVIERAGRPLAAFWADVEARAAGRVVVIHGLGNGGRALCRALHHTRSVDARSVRAHDDGHDAAPPGILRLDRREAPGGSLDAETHYAIVTPIAARGLERALEARGLVRHEAWNSMADLVRAEDGAERDARGRASIVASSAR